MPIISELPKKISAKDSATIAPMPQRAMACGACSRDDPQPKFACANSNLRAAVSRVVERMRRAALGQLAPIVLEDVILEAVERDGLEEPRRNDAVGVDVVAAQGNARGR